jgi:hypothetical protein
MAETCIVGVQLAASVVEALNIHVTDQGDVYANYSMSGVPEAHASYHASGQQHFKKGGKYVEWNGGPTGDFEPMKLYRRVRQPLSELELRGGPFSRFGRGWGFSVESSGSVNKGRHVCTNVHILSGGL